VTAAGRPGSARARPRCPCRSLLALGLAWTVGSVAIAADGYGYGPSGSVSIAPEGYGRPGQGVWSGYQDGTDAYPRQPAPYPDGPYRPHATPDSRATGAGWADRRAAEYRTPDASPGDGRRTAPWTRQEYRPGAGPGAASTWQPPAYPGGGLGRRPESEYPGTYSPWEMRGERPWARQESGRRPPRADRLAEPYGPEGQGPGTAPPPPPAPPPVAPYVPDPYLPWTGGGPLTNPGTFGYGAEPSRFQ
jgi:hypothetical protein